MVPIVHALRSMAVSARSRVGAALVLAGALAYLAPAAGAQQSSVALVSCPTTYGVKQAPPRLPKHIGVAASHAALKELSAYSNGVLILLAPRAWRCHAIVGADGSAEIAVTRGNPAHAAQPAITEHFSGTPGDAASLACALFPAAAQQLGGVPCQRHSPPQESIKSVNAQTVEFVDPAHVRGDGIPSGGSDPARGVMAFLAAGSGFAGYAFTATCTLPGSEHSICKTILNDALTRIPAQD
jgi:hypothetical protein